MTCSWRAAQVVLGTAENVRDLAKILRAVSTIPREKKPPRPPEESPHRDRSEAHAFRRRSAETRAQRAERPRGGGRPTPLMHNLMRTRARPGPDFGLDLCRTDPPMVAVVGGFPHAVRGCFRSHRAGACLFGGLIVYKSPNRDPSTRGGLGCFLAALIIPVR